MVCLEPFSPQRITLENFGPGTIDISGYWISRNTTIAVNTLTIISGSLVLGVGQQVVLEVSFLDFLNSVVALWTSNADFGDFNLMQDFVQWGTSGSATEALAVAKGLWSPGDQLGGAQIKYQYIGNGTENGLAFWTAGTPTTTTTSTTSTTSTSTTTTSTTTSTTTTVPPVTQPGPPENIQCVEGDGLIAINFNPPTDNGGSPIVQYSAVGSPVFPGGTVSSATSPIIVTGLFNGTGYFVTLTADNGTQVSIDSAPVGPCTPQATCHNW